MSGFKLAIDGPAGSGKSTISALIAKELGWTHIDTGAMYRAVTLKAIRQQNDLNDETTYRFLESSKIYYQNNRIWIDEEDVSEAIRSDEVTQHVSLVSSFPYVRQKMVEKQMEAAEIGNIIMDGRDIGTVVLPKADLKIFLTAQVEERAKRRQKEQLKKGKEKEIHHVIQDIVTRDEKDSNRVASPLKIAKDAIILDTTKLTIDDVVKQIIELIDIKEKKHAD